MPFRNRTHENDTELSKYIWSLKDKDEDFHIKCSIFAKYSGYSIVSKSYILCLFQKLVICTINEKDRLLNK